MLVRNLFKKQIVKHRAQQMLDVIIAKYGLRLLRKGVRVQKTVAEMAGQVGRDTDLGRYLDSLPGETLFTQADMNVHLRKPMQGLASPEKVFVYLREVRAFTETLLALKET